MPTPAVKFCGLTNRDDAAAAAAAGASYLGVIFAGGPRQLTPERAAEVLGTPTPSVARVGVFGQATPSVIASVAQRLSLDVVQLHADPTPEDVESVRHVFSGHIWAALRVRGERLPAHAAALFDTADAIVLDAHAPRGDVLGGTGVALAWETLREEVDAVRVRRRALVVLAGGLNASNVERAIMTLAPDVVDVSSGVERAPGIKDHDQLRAFGESVRRSVRLSSRP